MKSEKDLEAIARKYGGTASLDDLASRYGGTVTEEAPTVKPVKFPKPGLIEPPIPPATMGGLGAEFGLGAAETAGFPMIPSDRETNVVDMLTTPRGNMEMLRRAGPVIGAVGRGLYETGKTLVSGPLPQLEFLKGVAKAPIAPFQTVATGIERGDPNMVARGAGGAVVSVPATIMGLGSAARAGGR